MRLPCRAGWAMLAALMSVIFPMRTHVHAADITPRRPTCPAGPPAAVVRAYYASAATGNRAGVRACFAPPIAATLSGNSAYAPWNNIASARVKRTRVRLVPVS
jgi:hypothetical protein